MQGTGKEEEVDHTNGAANVSHFSIPLNGDATQPRLQVTSRAF
jgi:hypothetical protein